MEYFDVEAAYKKYPLEFFPRRDHPYDPISQDGEEVCGVCGMDPISRAIHPVYLEKEVC